MNYGRYGRELLLDCTRPSQPYRDATIQACLQDVRLHMEALQDQSQAAQEASDDGNIPVRFRPSILLQTAAIRRNKQCLLAYHVHRLRHMVQTTNKSKNLSPVEQAFQDDYHQARQVYFANMGVEECTIPPPPTDRVQVRVVCEKEQTIVLPHSCLDFQLVPGATVWMSRMDAVGLSPSVVAKVDTVLE